MQDAAGSYVLLCTRDEHVSTRSISRVLGFSLSIIGVLCLISLVCIPAHPGNHDTLTMIGVTGAFLCFFGPIMSIDSMVYEKAISPGLIRLKSVIHVASLPIAPVRWFDVDALESRLVLKEHIYYRDAGLNGCGERAVLISIFVLRGRHDFLLCRHLGIDGPETRRRANAHADELAEHLGVKVHHDRRLRLVLRPADRRDLFQRRLTQLGDQRVERQREPADLRREDVEQQLPLVGDRRPHRQRDDPLDAAELAAGGDRRLALLEHHPRRQQARLEEARKVTPQADHQPAVDLPFGESAAPLGERLRVAVEGRELALQGLAFFLGLRRIRLDDRLVLRHGRGRRPVKRGRRPRRDARQDAERPEDDQRQPAKPADGLPGAGFGLVEVVDGLGGGFVGGWLRGVHRRAES
ncbi:unnamed protein product [Cladocopium goreaui]|uniref:Uncharacterized protein n=1 Tax=Cladocopium goreaui TaxID=2562237 RepID=A0A9P1G1S1_9DINO|nr:unnamed protein product [Cladocopium goreaui]